jgi:hypothetical protein
MDVLGRTAMLPRRETFRRELIAGQDMISVAARTIYVRTERASTGMAACAN